MSLSRHFFPSCSWFLDISAGELAITLKSQYKDHSKEPKNVALISSGSLYAGQNDMHYS
jgi:hypothetical protein